MSDLATNRRTGESVSVDLRTLDQLGKQLKRSLTTGDEPPTEMAEKLLDHDKRLRRELVKEALKVACPEWLEKRAVENGEALGIKVVIVFNFPEREWRVRMTTTRGTVEAAPLLGLQSDLVEAWTDSLRELGLISS